MFWLAFAIIVVVSLILYGYVLYSVSKAYDDLHAESVKKNAYYHITIHKLSQKIAILEDEIEKLK